MVGSLQKMVSFTCRNCTEGDAKVADEVKQFMLGNNDRIEVMETFCYLGDVIRKVAVRRSHQ